MAEKDKNRKTNLPGFIRYRRDNLTNTERNAFERELQKDPFAEEAEEGFSMIEPGRISKDMEILNRQLKSRTSTKSSRFILYRIAASVAVLMVITTVFIIIQKSNPAIHEKIAGSESPEMAVKARPAIVAEKSKGIVKEPVLADISKTEKKDAIPHQKSEKKPDEVMPIATVDTFGALEKLKTADVKNLAIAGVAAPDTIPKVEENLMVVNQTAIPPVSEKRIRGDMPGAAATGRVEIKKTAFAGYIPAAPSDGQENFNRYIEENIRRPDFLNESQRIFVDVSFIVKLTGKPDSIKAVMSPGQSYSDEAIRLIKEGPLWTPANKNGVLVEDVVRLRIVFK